MRKTKDIIEEAIRLDTTSLDLDNQGISRIPEEVFACVQTTMLNLGNNEIKGLLISMIKYR